MKAHILGALNDEELKRAEELIKQRELLIEHNTTEESREDGVLHRWMTGVMQ